MSELAPAHTCSRRLLQTPTQVLVGLGSALAYAAGGRDLALPFALGGASGMLYQYMLQVRCSVHSCDWMDW